MEKPPAFPQPANIVSHSSAIPFATMVNREWGNTGQNYLRSLLALGFQAFLIMICVGIYAVLVESISLSGDNISGAIWGCMGYTVLLCFTLFNASLRVMLLFMRTPPLFCIQKMFHERGLLSTKTMPKKRFENV